MMDCSRLIPVFLKASLTQRHQVCCWLARTGFLSGLQALAVSGLLPEKVHDENGRSGACWAAYGGDPDVLLFCLEAWGRSIDHWGRSELHYLASGIGVAAMAPVAQLLSRYGIDPLICDKSGMQAVHLALDPGYWAWHAAVLWGRGGDVSAERILGVPTVFLSPALPPGYVEWLERFTDRKQRSMTSFIGEADAQAVVDQILVYKEKIRVEMLNSIDLQNCIVKELGIE